MTALAREWIEEAEDGHLVTWRGKRIADTVERYAKFDPEYFEPVIKSIDRLFEAIASEAKNQSKSGAPCE